MQYRRMGDAGIRLSAIGVGGWLTFGRSLDGEAVRAVVRTAVDHGVVYFDLADAYARGEAETVFGAALGEHRRQDLVISSKAYWPMSDNANDRGLSRKHLFESVEGSLRRLGTDYLDLYFCHRFDAETPLEETVRAMDDLVHHGKVLYWGTSVWEPAQIDEAVAIADRLGGYAPRVEQPRYNLLDRHVEEAILPTCARHGIGVVAWSPLAEGLLTGKYDDGVPADSRMAVDERMRRNVVPGDVERARALGAVARDLGVPLARMALAWCLRRPELTAVITGASRPEQVAENAAAAELVLDAETLARIDAALAQ